MAGKGNPRLDQNVRETVARIIEDDISDPRLTLVTITEARVTTDQKHATLYWSRVDDSVVSGTSEEHGGDRLPDEDEVMAGFEAANNRIRALLAKRADLRRSPELVFKKDDVAESAATLEALIRDVRGR